MEKKKYIVVQDLMDWLESETMSDMYVELELENKRFLIDLENAYSDMNVLVLPIKERKRNLQIMTKEHKNFTVYRVYDDEWEEIMGIGQLTEFALNQLCDKYDDFIDEAETLEDYHDKDLVRRIKELGKKVFEDKNENLTISEIETVFEAFCFEYERVTLY